MSPIFLWLEILAKILCPNCTTPVESETLSELSENQFCPSVFIDDAFTQPHCLRSYYFEDFATDA